MLGEIKKRAETANTIKGTTDGLKNKSREGHGDGYSLVQLSYGIEGGAMGVKGPVRLKSKK